MDMGVEVVRAGREHVDRIKELWNGLIEYHGGLDPLYTTSDEGRKVFAEYLDRFLGSEESRVACAMIDDKVVGYCISVLGTHPPVLVGDKYGFIMDMFVDKEFRRTGAGRALLDDAIDWARGKGMNRMELRAHTKNELGVGFWKASGFQEYLKVMYKEI